MVRLHRHGRSGLFMTGISAVDCALWDLKGKAWGQPVYRLLGGPTRQAVTAYASMLGFSIDPDQAVETALAYQAMGYSAQKWFFRFGPGDGEAGKAKNLALAQALRQVLGPHYPLMFDAYMGWDLTYAIDMARKLEPINPTWLEEPFQPERLGAFRKLKKESRIPIATGEHIYTRWQVKELLQAGSVDFIQTDPDWTGGITELVKICSLASAYDVPVVAHGHSLLAALHVAASQPPDVVPMVEYLVRFQPQKQHFHRPVFQPEKGLVKLPEQPGLGIVVEKTAK
jgi:L-alanine-DL-glutamate epimerase-like enolase superfamily enzyme